MYINIYGLEHIHNQEEYDYHDEIIDTFKFKYYDAFKYANPRCGNITVEFDYNTETRKFRLRSIEKLKHVHDRLVKINRDIKYFFE